MNVELQDARIDSHVHDGYINITYKLPKKHHHEIENS